MTIYKQQFFLSICRYQLLVIGNPYPKMLASLSLIFLAIMFLASEINMYLYNTGVPPYIKRALREKDKYRPFPKASKKTFHDITMKQVLDKINKITRRLNKDALMNGYKVDYKLRIFNQGLLI